MTKNPFILAVLVLVTMILAADYAFLHGLTRALLATVGVHI